MSAWTSCCSADVISILALATPASYSARRRCFWAGVSSFGPPLSSKAFVASVNAATKELTATCRRASFADLRPLILSAVIGPDIVRGTIQPLAIGDQIVVTVHGLNIASNR